MNQLTDSFFKVIEDYQFNIKTKIFFLVNPCSQLEE